jgi:hypothetical protein
MRLPTSQRKWSLWVMCTTSNTYKVHQPLNLCAVPTRHGACELGAHHVLNTTHPGYSATICCWVGNGCFSHSSTSWCILKFSTRYASFELAWKWWTYVNRSLGPNLEIILGGNPTHTKTTWQRRSKKKSVIKEHCINVLSPYYLTSSPWVKRKP